MFNEPDKEFMQQAIKLAKYAKKQGEVPIGAILVLDNNIIGQGYNCPTKSNDPTSHAEINALRNAAVNLQNYRLPDTTLYVTLEPCLMCAGAIVHARIKRLVFGAKDPKAGAVISVFNVLDESKLNHHIQYEYGLFADECGQLLESFFRKKR